MYKRRKMAMSTQQTQGPGLMPRSDQPQSSNQETSLHTQAKPWVGTRSDPETEGAPRPQAVAKITIADCAAGHIVLCSGLLRIRVQSGGCAGMRYIFTFEESLSDQDLLSHHANGARVVVDPLSHIFLEGGTLQYQKELLASTFVFINPKASNACGCGDSFSIF
jgi:iron-sulfur cluster assembly protein